jgi:hypothetical protein
MRRTLRALLLGISATVVSGFSSGAQTPPPMYGFGASQCATFLNDIRLHPEAKALYFSWAQGFISSANALLPGAGVVPNLTASLNEDAQQSALVDICKQNPGEDFSRASIQLLDRIRISGGLKPILNQ